MRRGVLLSLFGVAGIAQAQSGDVFERAPYYRSVFETAIMQKYYPDSDYHEGSGYRPPFFTKAEGLKDIPSLPQECYRDAVRLIDYTQGIIIGEIFSPYMQAAETTYVKTPTGFVFDQAYDDSQSLAAGEKRLFYRARFRCEQNGTTLTTQFEEPSPINRKSDYSDTYSLFSFRRTYDTTEQPLLLTSVSRTKFLDGFDLKGRMQHYFLEMMPLLLQAKSDTGNTEDATYTTQISTDTVTPQGTLPYGKPIQLVEYISRETTYVGQTSNNLAKYKVTTRLTRSPLVELTVSTAYTQDAREKIIFASSTTTGYEVPFLYTDPDIPAGQRHLPEVREEIEKRYAVYTKREDRLTYLADGKLSSWQFRYLDQEGRCSGKTSIFVYTSRYAYHLLQGPGCTETPAELLPPEYEPGDYLPRGWKISFDTLSIGTVPNGDQLRAKILEPRHPAFGY